MEVLSRGWNILISENEMLTKIIVSPTVIIEDWLAFLLIVLILQIDYTLKKKISYISFLSIISLVTEFFIPAPYNVVLNYLIMFIFVKINLNLKIIKTILAVIIPTAIFSLVGNLILNPFLTILDITYAQTQNIALYRLLYLFTLYFIVFLITRLLKIKSLELPFIEDLSSENKKIIILNLIFAIITLSIQLIITFYYISTYPIFFTFLNFISLLAYFFISFYSLTRTMDLQITTRNLENAESYNNTLSILYDNIKAFKHDFDNMVYTIGGYINTNDLEGLKSYYKDLEKDCLRVNNTALLNPQVINNPGIYNLLMNKYKKAQELNVEISLDFFFDFNTLNMPIYEFSRILGILLDNAIEAASEATDKKVKLTFRDSTSNHTQIIVIENTYNNHNIDKSKIFQKGVTEKANHTGMGLWEVRQILLRNNNVTLITDNNELFKQQLEILY